jgi:putative SOS response-associated peptidase YedK
MCGRFILLTDLSVIVESFHIGEVAAEYKTGVNITPGQQIIAVIREQEINKLVNFRWGLIPSWAKEPSIGNKAFNARAETVAEKPSFREAFKKRRCLIVADGFYEWQKSAKAKKPFRFKLRSSESFAFAGLYETWTSPENKPVRTCTIITTDANELIKPIHDRMPVIVPKDKESLWLDPGAPDQREPAAILKPYPAGEMEMAAGLLTALTPTGDSGAGAGNDSVMLTR